MIQQVNYTNSLVNSLISIAELNSQINFFIRSKSINDDYLRNFSIETKSTMLYDFLLCIGQKVNLKDARKVVNGMHKSPTNPSERLLVNIGNAFDYIENSYNYEDFSISLLNHLNKLILVDIKDSWDVSKMINRVEDIDSIYNFFKKDNTILEPKSTDYLQEIADYYSNDSSPSLLKAIVVIYNLLTTNLYQCANDVTVLCGMKFLFRKDGINEYINFYKVISSVNKKVEENDFTIQSWIELYLETFEKEMNVIRDYLNDKYSDSVVVDSAWIDISSRQIKGIEYIKEKGKINRELYTKLNSVSSITAYRDLNDLLQKGYLKVEGIGKATKYSLK